MSMPEHTPDPQRDALRRMLAEGLATEVAPVPEDHNDFERIAARLRVLGPADLKQKAVIAGLVNHPQGEERMRCQECMYFLLNRRWCDLPDLNIPVEHDWWCRLWRI